ncbi:MAG: glycosyltransferase family 39 protein [Armatimonadota bacterium]|nr:glycosyltransferase family 39 protein [Armatimonadota bacterium]
MEPPSEARDILNPKLTRRGVWIAALVLFLLALGLRLVGIGWGLPNDQRNQSLHPDEQLIYLVGTQTPYFRPGFYNYGSLYFTAIHFANDAGMSYGWIPVGDDVPIAETTKAGLKTGRIVSAIAGAATVSIVFATLLLVTGSLGSLIGAFSMLLAPAHVVHSRFQTTDVIATMLIALAAYLLIRAVQSDGSLQWKRISGMGMVIGLAAGTKYTGILLLIPAAIVFWKIKADVKQYAMLLGAAIVGFLMATPGILLETMAFLRGFTYELGHSAEGHGLVFVDTPPGVVYHFLNSAEAFGMIPMVLGIVGLVWAAAARKPWAIVAASFFVVYFIVIGMAEVKFLRYVFPLLPFLALGLGYLAGRCHEGRGWKRVITGAAILFVVVGTGATSGAFTLTRLMTMQDTRDESATWIREEAEHDATIGLVSDPWFYTPPFFPDIGLLATDERLGAMAEYPHIVRYIAPDGEKKDWDMRLLESPPAYIVFSSFEFLDHDRLSEPNFVAFIDRMKVMYDFVAMFWDAEPALAASPKSKVFDRSFLRVLMRERYPKTHDMMYIRPTICVFKLKSQP